MPSGGAAGEIRAATEIASSGQYHLETPLMVGPGMVRGGEREVIGGRNPVAMEDVASQAVVERCVKVAGAVAGEGDSENQQERGRDPPDQWISSGTDWR